MAQNRSQIFCRQMNFAGSGLPGRNITSPVERGNMLIVITSFLVTPTLRHQKSTSWVSHLLKNRHPRGFYQRDTTLLVFGFPLLFSHLFLLLGLFKHMFFVHLCTVFYAGLRRILIEFYQSINHAVGDVGPCDAQGRCRISPPRFLAESRKRRLSQGSFVSAVFSCLYSLICTVFMCVFL